MVPSVCVYVCVMSCVCCGRLLEIMGNRITEIYSADRMISDLDPKKIYRVEVRYIYIVYACDPSLCFLSFSSLLLQLVYCFSVTL